MDLKKVIPRFYQVNDIIDIREPGSGSGTAFIITTPTTKYVAKWNERLDFVRVYHRVQLGLNKRGLRQSKIIRTTQGKLITPVGLVLYEFIEGDHYRVLNNSQISNCLQYIARYNRALADIPFIESELEEKVHWDKAKSLIYTITDFPQVLKRAKLESSCQSIVLHGVNVLAVNREKLKTMPKQLIHSDLGADNFIFDKNNVKTIIDFTPEYNHPYYSLGQFVYWNYLWQSKAVDAQTIDSMLRVYHGDRFKKHDIDLFVLLLIKAVLFRIIGRFLSIYDSGKIDYSILSRRINILTYLLEQFKTISMTG